MSVSLISTEDGRRSETKILEKIFSDEYRPAALHIRKPGWSAKEKINYLDTFSESLKYSCVLHLSTSDLILLPAFKSTGVALHLSEAARLKVKQAADIFSSSSFHTLKELEESHSPFTKVFISPVFDSISSDKKPCLERENIKNFLSRANSELKNKVVALGGVSSSKLMEVRELGFRQIAIKGAVWGSTDPLSACETVVKEWTKTLQPQ